MSSFASQDMVQNKTTISLKTKDCPQNWDLIIIPNILKAAVQTAKNPPDFNVFHPKIPYHERPC